MNHFIPAAIPVEELEFYLCDICEQPKVDLHTYDGDTFYCDSCDPPSPYMWLN